MKPTKRIEVYSRQYKTQTGHCLSCGPDKDPEDNIYDTYKEQWEVEELK